MVVIVLMGVVIIVVVVVVVVVMVFMGPRTSNAIKRRKILAVSYMLKFRF
jgi:hypothetical protein